MTPASAGISFVDRSEPVLIMPVASLPTGAALPGGIELTVELHVAGPVAVALAFTSVERLVTACGPRQPWAALRARAAVPALAAAGVQAVLVDAGTIDTGAVDVGGPPGCPGLPGLGGALVPLAALPSLASEVDLLQPEPLPAAPAQEVAVLGREWPVQ